VSNPNVNAALALARKISSEKIRDNRVTDTEAFLNMLRNMEPGDLTEVIALLASYDDNPAAVSKSLREGAIVAADAKNTKAITEAVSLLESTSKESAQSIVKATENFDKKAFWLTFMLIVLSIIGLLVAFIPDSWKEPILKSIMGQFPKW
jgi:hypothetical protein